MRYHIEKIPHSIIFAVTLEDLYNNHKINFNGENIGSGRTRHTSLDWFLVPTERPSIDIAPLKEYYIDIPGANGGLDLTESLTGSPLYDYIEGSFKFTILNDRKLPILNNECELTKEIDISWEVLNRDIRNFLNGKEMYMLLEDDPSWYYHGRFTVEKYDSSDSANSKITINYKVYPFKRLSLYDTSNENYRNTYFDALPLNNDDIQYLFSSFWLKTDMTLYPGADGILFTGELPGDLPCGQENTSVIFKVRKSTNSFTPTVIFTSPSGTYTKLVETEAGTAEQSVKVRDIILSNKNINKNTNPNNNSVLYSDNTLRLTLGFPTAFSNKPYKKDDIVSYVGDQKSITWVLKANGDITASENIDITEWSVDINAMPIDEFSESDSYDIGDMVYASNVTGYEGKIMLLIATGVISAGPFDTSQWSTDISSVPISKIYKPVRVSIAYDIGVM